MSLRVALRAPLPPVRRKSRALLQVAVAVMPRSPTRSRRMAIRPPRPCRVWQALSGVRLSFPERVISDHLFNEAGLRPGGNVRPFSFGLSDRAFKREEEMGFDLFAHDRAARPVGGAHEIEVNEIAEKRIHEVKPCGIRPNAGRELLQEGCDQMADGEELCAILVALDGAERAHRPQ